MNERERHLVAKALTLMEFDDEPSSLIELANRLEDGAIEQVTGQALLSWLDSATAGDSLMTTLGRLLARWDAATQAPWAEQSVANTRLRRDVIYGRLGLSSLARHRIDELRPVLGSGTTIVSEQFERWLSPKRLEQRSFYWRNYRDFLLHDKQWTPDTVNALDEASSSIVERLGDPTATIPRSQRGLVIGYVQSGKTANLSAVAAKAIDVGYRFIIVLTGMHEALRRQTQRRLDMEVIGRPNIMDDGYADDPAWIDGKFATLNGDVPSPQIVRLTSQFEDFNRHLTHTLLLKPHGTHGHLFDEENLYPLPVRIAVVKKNKDVLGHLLKAMKANDASMAEVPALIIDDESDQASVNTAKPTWRSPDEGSGGAQQRKAINEAITGIMRLMPRSQYIGYTATPFANVFVDPDDTEDLFPRDFIISLPEPPGYMGASSFFNSVQPVGLGFELSNKDAYIRELRATDTDLEGQNRELQRAIAAFVVAGAVKLFRMSVDPGLEPHFNHHTMLVHEASQTIKHRDLAQRITSIWRDSEWRSSHGRALLQGAFEDFRPTLEDRQDPSAPFVDSFSEITPFIEQALARIEAAPDSFKLSPENVAWVVNSDTEVARKLDFNRHSTWKIVVGGAMLSRGFTIEGLTVSYFRRSPQAQDTLLQMGRWFGYRPGYRDLVRIYLASNTAISKRQLVNLYDAFDSMAETEAEFRAQLTKYAEWDGDTPAITPKQVVPLVAQALPWLKPTAANKMYNARIVTQREPVFSPKALPWKPEGVRRNWELLRPFVFQADEHLDIRVTQTQRRHVPAWVGIVPAGDLELVLKNLEYLDGYGAAVVDPKVAYYRHSIREHLLDDFLIVFPQLLAGPAKSKILAIPDLGDRSLATRTRNAKDWYGEFTDPEHRAVADAFLGVGAEGCPDALLPYHSKRRGVVLAYLIAEKGPSSDPLPAQSGDLLPDRCTVGLTIYLPKSALDPRTKGITWGVVSPQAVQ